RALGPAAAAGGPGADAAGGPAAARAAAAAAHDTAVHRLAAAGAGPAVRLLRTGGFRALAGGPDCGATMSDEPTVPATGDNGTESPATARPPLRHTLSPQDGIATAQTAIEKSWVLL